VVAQPKKKMTALGQVGAGFSNFWSKAKGNPRQTGLLRPGATKGAGLIKAKDFG